MNARSFGFTLIELMIVVAVVALIAAIAIPSYNNSILRSKREMGKAELMEVLSQQEQYFINNKQYATDLTTLGYGANPYYIDDEGTEVASGASIYEISLSAATATAFTVQAAPQNGQTSDTDCATLRLSSTGTKTATGGGSRCW